MTRGTKSGIVLDWFTVTYRSVFLTVALVVAAGLGAYFFWPPGGRGDADAAIASAESKYAQAARLPSGTENVAPSVQSVYWKLESCWSE